MGGLSYGMGGWRKKLQQLSSPNVALPAPRSAQTGDGRGATMATPSPVAMNVAFSPVPRTAPPVSRARERASVNSSRRATLVPDHDPSAAENSGHGRSAPLPPAELDPFGDGLSSPQTVVGIQQLEDKHSRAKMSEGFGGLLRSPVSSNHTRGTVADPAELEATQHNAGWKRTGASEMDAAGDMTRGQADGKAVIIAPHERYQIDQEIRKAAAGLVDNSELETEFRKRGTSGALKLLVKTYGPELDSAYKELDSLEDKIRAALEGHVRLADVDKEIRQRGLAGAFQLLLRQYQSSLEAEQALGRVEEKMRSATHDIRGADKNYGRRTGGAEAMLALIVDDYQGKKAASLELERVASQIKRATPQVARKDVDVALKSRDSGVQSALDVLVGAYQPYVAAHKELVAVETELKRAARETSWSQDVELLLKRYGPEGALKNLVRHLQANTESLRNIEAQASGFEQRWKKSAGEVRELRREQARHQAKIDDLNENHRLKMADLDNSWKEVLEKRQKEAASQAQMVDLRHRSELESRDTSHRNEVDTWRATMQSVKEKHENEQKDAKAALEKARQESKAELDRQRVEFEARAKEARRREMERFEQIRLEAEELKGELVKREHFKGLSDPEICNRFKKLTGEVDNFSRIQWEKKREASWPVPEYAFQKSENPRKFKQQMVQSTIWMILKEKIFHSPFGVLGDAGQSMHCDWTSEFGEDRNSELPNWPEPTEESETWRFDRVKEYWDASKKPDSEASRRLKPMYDQSVSAAVADIRKATEAISTLEPRDLQPIRELVEVAATFWLDVMAQKCRVYVIFPAQGAKALVHRKPANTTADLVIQPEVRRRGNAQGQRFAKEQVIKGCEGEKTRF